MNLPELFPTEIDTHEQPLQVSVDYLDEDSLYRIVKEFTKAKYELTALETKTWFIFLSEMKEFRNQNDIIYEINPVEIADMLKLPKRRARSKKVIDTFKSLMKKSIEIENKEVVDKYGNPTLFASTFFATVYYNAKKERLYVRMVPELHKLLFNFVKSIESVGIDLKNILSLKRTTSIRVFIAFKDMDDRNINSISIEDFKKIADSENYTEFRDIKKRIILPVESDIRENTDYKDFNISYNGGKGKGCKTTTLFFEMKDSNRDRIEAREKRENMLDSFRKAPPSVKLRLRELQDKTLSVLEQALFLGFDMNYLTKIPLEKEGLIVENILSTMDWIYKQTNDYNKTFSADERGRLIYSAIMKNKANVAIDEPQNSQEKLVLTSETDSSTLEAMYLAAARKYVKALSNNDFMTFAVNNQHDIERIFRTKLDLNDLLKRDGRKAAYKLLVRYVVLLATKNQLDIGIKVK